MFPKGMKISLTKKNNWKCTNKHANKIKKKHKAFINF